MIPVSNHYETVVELAESLDGLLLSGGGDINPLYFGEEPIRGLGRVHPFRDELELRLIQAVLQKGKPILGICRGCQILNVATGGDMYQDLPSQVKNVLQHSQRAPRFHASHTVGVERGTRLFDIFQTDVLAVNSFHHQANRSVGSGYRVSVTAKDGVMEAFESVDHPFVIGVQWHPENMIEVDPLANRLFDAFVQSCLEK